MLIKYIKSVLWRVAKRLSYKQDFRCLKVNENPKQSFEIQITIKKRLENMEYCNNLGSTVTDDARYSYTSEINSRIVMAKAAFDKRGIAPEKAS